jgi:Ca2+/H+ antiporter
MRTWGTGNVDFLLGFIPIAIGFQYLVPTHYALIFATADWLKGVQLIAVYLIFGLAFFLVPQV